ncbi:MAG: hypothetical protein ACI9SB_002933 [Candidatus Azotimanducaceae bacterium]|jgi:hypothetical protein
MSPAEGYLGLPSGYQYILPVVILTFERFWVDGILQWMRYWP